MAERTVGASRGSHLHVAVVARSPALRAGLAMLLEESAGDGSPITIATAADMTALETDAPIDVVVMQPDGDLERRTPELPDEFTGMPVVIVAEASPAGSGRTVAVGGGPTAWLRIDVGGEELVAAVRAVAAGLDVYDPALGDRAGASTTVTRPGEQGREQGDDDDSEPLTRREIEVLQKLVGGLTNKAIAFDLGISEHTVKYHVGSILTKLDASGRTEAVAVGVRRGLIAL